MIINDRWFTLSIFYFSSSCRLEGELLKKCKPQHLGAWHRWQKPGTLGHGQSDVSRLNMRVTCMPLSLFHGSPGCSGLTLSSEYSSTKPLFIKIALTPLQYGLIAPHCIWMLSHPGKLVDGLGPDQDDMAGFGNPPWRALPLSGGERWWGGGIVGVEEEGTYRKQRFICESGLSLIWTN